MLVRNLELFKSLLEATYWFKTHPKDTTYRITVNKTRFLIDKARAMRLMRLYLPYVNRLDDDKLIAYIYANNARMIALASSGDMSLDEPSPNLVETIDKSLAATESEKQQLLDEAIKKEEERQKKDREKREKEKQEADKKTGDSGNKENPPTPAATTPPTVNINETDSTEEDTATDSGTTSNATTLPVSTISTTSTTPIATKQPTSSPTTDDFLNRVRQTSKERFKRRVLTPSVSSKPDFFEKTMGGVGNLAGGFGLSKLGKDTGSSGQILIKKGFEKARSSVEAMVPESVRQIFGSRNDTQTSDYYSYDLYDEWEEDEYEEIYRQRRLPQESGKKARFLGIALWVWVIIIIVLVFVIFNNQSDDSPVSDVALVSPAPTSTGPGPSGGGDSYLACRFTRAGQSRPIGSSILMDWIVEAANKAQLPPAIMASVAMHENPDFSANAKNDHDGIVQNRLCNKSPSFCVLRGQVLHSQAYTTGRDDPCTPAEIEAGAETAQAVGLMQFLDIYNKGKDLCSITVSLDLAAAKLSSSGIGMNPTADEVNRAIRAYHGSCSYGSYDYCAEVFEDFKNCVPTTNTASCEGGWPVSGSITQGPVGGSHSEYTGTSRVAVDIAAAVGTPVYSTFTGTLVDLSAIDTGWSDGRGIFVSIVPDRPGKNGAKGLVRYLHFSNLAENLQKGQKVTAGQLIGYVGETGRVAGAHLHMDFENMDMAPPNIPQAILPPSCAGNCSPRGVTVCK